MLASGPAAALQLGEVSVTGVDDELLDNVTATLSLAQQPTDRPLSEARLEYLIEQVPEEARRALEPFGYYDAEVEVRPARVGEAVSVVVRVMPGQPVRVDEQHVEVRGDATDDPIIERLQADFEPDPGDILRHDVYEASKTDIQRGLLARGYFGAELERARVEVTRATHAADILLDWNSGPRSHFGELRFEGSHIETELLRNRARQFVEAGEPFDQTDLLLMHQALVELDYFSVVEVQPLPEEAAGTPPLVPIGVNLEPAKQNIYRAGISFGTDFGVGVQLGYDRRWVNRFGHKFTSELEVSQRRSVLAAQYRVPQFERLPGWWAFGVRAEQNETESVDSDVLGLLVSRSTTWRDDSWVAEFHVDRERFDAIGDDAAPDEQRYTTLVYPALRFERSRLDEPLYPRSGYGISAQVRAGSSAIGSDVDFAQAWTRLRGVIGLGDWTRFIVALELGRTWGSEFEALPPSLRFYAGGDRSVRGYGYQALGPRNDAGDVIGGRNLLAGSIEFERMFTERWGGAIFVDAGNAFSDDDFEPAVGVGIGLRWRSPIGPVRVDVAHGLDEPEQVVRLHIGIGPQL